MERKQHERRNDQVACPLCGAPRYQRKDGQKPLVCQDCNKRYFEEKELFAATAAELIMEGITPKDFPSKFAWTVQQISIPRFSREAQEAQQEHARKEEETRSLAKQRKKEAKKDYLDDSVYKKVKNMCYEEVGGKKAYGKMKRYEERLVEARKVLEENQRREKMATKAEVKNTETEETKTSIEASSNGNPSREEVF